MTTIIKSNKVATKTLGNIFGLAINDYSLLADFDMGEYRLKSEGAIQRVNLNEFFDFTRASKASYFNGDELLVAGINEPRIHTDAVSGFKGLLIESGHTQLLSNIYAPATQTVTIVHDTTKRLVLSVRGLGSATIEGSVTLEPGSPSQSTENNPSLYASTANGAINVVVEGSLSAISLHYVDANSGISPKMFTPADLVTVAPDIFALKPSVLTAALNGSKEFTILMKATELKRPTGAPFLSRGTFFGVGDTSEVRKGIYMVRKIGSLSSRYYIASTDAAIIDENGIPVSTDDLNHVIALSYKPDASKVSFNGSVMDITAPFTMTANILQLGSNMRRSNLGSLNGIIRTLAIYPYAMTAEQLKTLV